MCETPRYLYAVFWSYDWEEESLFTYDRDEAIDWIAEAFEVDTDIPLTQFWAEVDASYGQGKWKAFSFERVDLQTCYTYDARYL